MKIRSLALASIIGLSLATAVVPQKSMAQLTNSQNYDQPNTNDLFNQGGGGQQNGFNMFQLLHNAQLGIGGYNPDAAKEQSQQLDEATTAFRARQLQLIQKGQAHPNNQPSSTIIKLEPASGK
jgi:hypothetical protein